MPIFTTSVIALPVYPFHSPPIMRSEKCFIFSSTAFTSGITSLPSTRIGVLLRLRSATCSTARSSVRLIFSPENIDLIAPLRSVSFASACSLSSVSWVMRFFEKSTSIWSSKVAENLAKRSASWANSSAIVTDFICSKCCCSAFQAAVWVGLIFFMATLLLI